LNRFNASKNMAENPERQPTDVPVELKSFEAQLGALAPAAARLNRDRVMYLAGAAAAEVRARGNDPAVGAPAVAVAPPHDFVDVKSTIWPIATAALALLSIGLATRLAWQDRQSPAVGSTRSAADSVRAADGGSHSDRSQIANVVPIETTGSIPAAGDSASYLVLREKALRLGVDSLDEPAAASGSAKRAPDVRNRALLHQLLEG
jgi:hypothetical protein